MSGTGWGNPSHWVQGMHKPDFWVAVTCHGQGGQLYDMTSQTFVSDQGQEHRLSGVGYQGGQETPATDSGYDKPEL